MTAPNVVGPEYLAPLLHRAVSTIRVDARRKPDSLPPRWMPPGTRKLLWIEEDVIAWMNALRPQVKRKIGRPSGQT